MDMQAFDLVRQLSASHYLVRSLHLVAELGVADAVGGAPVAIDTVAAQVGANGDALGRVLRLLASRGIFRVADGKVGHSPASEFLRSDHPASLRSFARMFGQSIQWDTAGQLMHAVKTGEAVATRVFPDGGLWGYFGAHPEDGRVFGEAMEAKSAAQIADLLAAHDFGQYRRIADIGGGHGHLLRAILAKYPATSGVVFDLPAVADAGRAVDANGRLEFVGGDFFSKPVPSGDAVILMEVLHDWDDADCARILEAVRRAASAASRLLVIEIEMTTGEGPDWPKLLDIVMLGAFGARQRTNAEYQKLLLDAGFRVEKQISTPAGMVIIEARAG